MIGGKRYTVVNTDAGIKGNVAAWAFWIRSDECKYVHSAKFKIAVTSSTEAELAAIVNALHFVSNDEYLRGADYIIVNCDNKGAIDMLNAGGCAKYPHLNVEYQKIKKIIGKPIKFKWVKGHSSGDSRKWVNNFIDKKIREHYK